MSYKMMHIIKSKLSKEEIEEDIRRFFIDRYSMTIDEIPIKIVKVIDSAPKHNNKSRKVCS